MSKLLARLALQILVSAILGLGFAYNTAFADKVKGIYVTQSSMEDTALINHFIKNAKNVGINTFVVDLELPNTRYKNNVALLKQNNIKYVVRIIMFPGGGTPDQIHSEAYWQRKYKLITTALSYGAQEVQLDYIRYNSHSGSSPQRAKDIYKIVSWYKNQLAAQNIPLQIDVFGISSFGEEPHIGQNIEMISQTVDTLCPMVYPSHYQPFKQHFETPYQTVYNSLASIQDQFDNKMPVKLVPYIELSNYHYPLSHTKKIAYIQAQLKAVKDAGADGWYAWSANNYYDTLFEVMALEKKS